MFRYIAKRVLQAIPLLFVISFIVFSLIHIAPYDVIDSITTPNMSQEQIDLLRQRYGLDQPFLVQYFLWIRNVLTGNLGFSLVSQSSISQELATRIPNTMRLVIPAYLTALLLAIILGLLAAANKGKIWDRIIDAVASLGIAVPTFWFAMILIYVFGYLLNMFPIIGMYTVGKEGDFGDFLQHFILPYITLTVAFFPDLTRYIRASATQQVSEDYVMVQRAFHASKWQIFSRHISRNFDSRCHPNRLGVTDVSYRCDHYRNDLRLAGRRTVLDECNEKPRLSCDHGDHAAVSNTGHLREFVSGCIIFRG